MDMGMKHFLFAVDDNFYKYLKVLTLSLVKFNQYPLMIHIFTMDSPESGHKKINDVKIEELKLVVNKYNHQAEIKVHNVREKYVELLSESVNKDTKFTPYAALRLLSPYILDIDKVVYLDADCVVCADISNLFTIEEEFDLAMVGYEEYGQCFVNSGVLILDLKNIRNNGHWSDVIDDYNNNLYEWPDQDAMSYCKTIKMHLVGEDAYNSMGKYNEETKIYHMCGSLKDFPAADEFYDIDVRNLFGLGNAFIQYLKFFSEEYSRREDEYLTSLERE